MLTPAQIKEYEFKSAGRNAYKAEDVDEFFSTVSVDYEKMFRENAELVKRVGLLADRLEQMKQDENDIKNAVISAQRAADLIVREAESSVADSRAEAESVLAAAKGEVEIIKEDAKKQAIADSELMLAMTRDKAEEIIKKAKEEAGSIIIEAKSSASDKVGAATRTITSESILFDMLKKEVSEFKTSILQQYKAHIELISKLPELAADEAAAIEPAADKEVGNTAAASAAEPSDFGFELSEDTDKGIATEDFEPDFSMVGTPESSAASVSFVDDADNTDEAFDIMDVGENDFGETVVKTELPAEFYSEATKLEFVSSDDEAEAEVVSDSDGFSGFSVDPDAAASLGFDFGISGRNDDGEEDEEDFNETADNDDDAVESTAEATEKEDGESSDSSADSVDIPVSHRFSVDGSAVSFSDISSFDYPEETEDEPDVKPRHSFFKKKNKQE